MASSRMDLAVGGLLRAAVSSALCVLMVGQPVLAEPLAANTVARPATGQISGDERIVHALDRFTFGPRPGDVAAVKAMGLERWFAQQLHPETIPDAELEQRLAQFPAMQMTQAELIQRYPSPQVLRQMMQQHTPLPSDPVEHAIYADDIAFYKKAQAKLAAGAPMAAVQAVASDAAMAAMAGDDKDAQSDAGMQALEAVGAIPAATSPAAKAKNQKVNLLGDDSMAAPRKKAAAGASDDMTNDMATGAKPQGGQRHKENIYPEVLTQQILSLPPEERVQRLLALSPDDLVAFRQSLSAVELVAVARDLNPQQKEILGALQGSARMIGGETLQSRLERDIYSERQLQAVMTDFWLNHFNVYIKKNQNEPYLLPEFENSVIRPNALGKFEDLLVATAKSPAMLMYLDNWQSVGPDSQQVQRLARLQQFAPNNKLVKNASKGLNENYGRELMELHTLGVNGGYTQADVTQVAKVFTGWTIDRPYQGGEYTFMPQRHEPGPKVVLGHTIQQGGENEGLQVLHILATSPATARFISTKLAVRFVSDTPPQALVDRMAKTFLDSGGDIKAVLTTMFKSPEFWTPEVDHAKMKTPEEFVVSAVRASGAKVNNAQPLVQALDKLGMPLYGMQTPNGYSWMAEPWVGTGDLVNRMNFALQLSGNRLNGVRTNWDRELGSAAPGMMAVSVASSGNGPETVAKEEKLEMLLLGHPASERTRATVLAQFANPETEQQAEKDFPLRVNDQDFAAGDGGVPQMVVQDRQAAVMAGLLMGSPEFQRR